MVEMCREKAIIFVGYAASAAALKIMEGQRERLCGRYSRDYLERGMNGLKRDFTDNAALPEAGGPGGTLYQIKCGEDGAFGALWRLGEELGCGLEVSLMQIPIRQIAIEMCDYADINPYESDSTGCSMVVTESPGAVLNGLKEAGCPAAVIGCTAPGNDRVVVNGEVRRFMTPVRG